MSEFIRNAQAFVDAYMSLIWWINGVVGGLFLLAWLEGRFGHRLERWLARQRQLVNERSHPDRSR
jgi:hypothetical protein